MSVESTRWRDGPMNEQTKTFLDDVSGFALGGDPGALEAMLSPGAATAPRGRAWSSAERSLMAAYRARGHLAARLDPLGLSPPAHVAELDPRQHGLDARASGDLIDHLQKSYCGPIGWDIGHIHDTARRQWLERQAEAGARALPDDASVRRSCALLAKARAFEDGLTKRIPGRKAVRPRRRGKLSRRVGDLLTASVAARRRGGRGRRHASRPLQHAGECVGQAARPHDRGDSRQAAPCRTASMCSSDVVLSPRLFRRARDRGRTLQVSVSPHPSHLQLAPIIAQGRARAKQTVRGPDGASAVLPLLLHTDASFAGQGLVAEMLQLSRVAPFDHRRHHPCRHQQPARLHDDAGGGPHRRAARPTSRG